MIPLTLVSTSRATDAGWLAAADMGVPFDVCGDDRLLAALLGAGYVGTQGNRFARQDSGRELVIDVLAPSYEGRLVTSQGHGQLVVDEIPGLLTALLEPRRSSRSRLT